MVSCQEPSPLKGSKHSKQCHPHDAALVNALSFVSMGVEARCRPSKSAAHPCHMKRQPFLCNGCPRCGRRHCHRRCHLHCHCRLRCRCRRHRHHRRRCNLPSLLPLPLAIAIAVAFNHCRCHLCRVAISHRCCPCPCPCHWPLPSLSPSAIAVAIAVGHHHCHAVGHFRELLPRRGKNCIQKIEAKNAYFILFCSDSGRRIDQSRMTDQVSSGNGQNQRWAASGEQ
jgi:hypothetical protein